MRPPRGESKSMPTSAPVADYAFTAEGAAPRGGQTSVLTRKVGEPERLGRIGAQVAAGLEEPTGKESRTIVLRHLLRGADGRSPRRLSVESSPRSTLPGITHVATHHQ